ncbi:hypothetical protein BDV06DRAFT_202374 [Aspergillus oleicola]
MLLPSLPHSLFLHPNAIALPIQQQLIHPVHTTPPSVSRHSTSLNRPSLPNFACG